VVVTSTDKAMAAGADGLEVRLRERAEELGLAAVGIARVGPFVEARRAIEERKASGFAAEMQFTYRDPARSTDPSRLLPGARALVVGAWYYGPPHAEASRARPLPAGPPHAGPPHAGPLPAGPPYAGHRRPVTEGRMAGDRPMGAVARYAALDHYASLRRVLGSLAAVLKEAGWAARVVLDDNGLVDRAAAHAAGLGWFGKNCNILLPGKGSWFVLGSVVTDAPLSPGRPIVESCGGCRRCLRACPTGALVSPGVLDARRCLAWLLQAPGIFPFEHRVALGARVYGCDDCQEVCPPNRVLPRPPSARRRQVCAAAVVCPAEGTATAADGPASDGPASDGTAAEGTAADGTAAEGTAADGTAAEGTAAEGTAAAGTAAAGTAAAGTAADGTAAEGTAAAGTAAEGKVVDLLALLTMSDADLMERYGRWYIPKREPRYLRRNALIALANVGDGRQPDVELVLTACLSSTDEMLQAHAVWAAARLDREDLVLKTEGLLVSRSPWVREELVRRSEVEPRRQHDQ